MQETQFELHYYYNENTGEWEIRNKTTGDLLGSFECDDDSIEWIEKVISSMQARIEILERFTYAVIAAHGYGANLSLAVKNATSDFLEDEKAIKDSEEA